MGRDPTGPERRAAAQEIRSLVARVCECRVVGKDNIEATLAGFYDSIKSLSHERQGLWEVDDTTIVWSDVTYTRPDDADVTVPVVTILRRNDGGLIVDYRIFMNAGPLFA
jgi:hypothetical protein